MKLFAAFLAAASTADAFSVVPRGRASTKLDTAAVYYDSQTGNTEKCAEYIASASGLKAEYIGTYVSYLCLVFQLKHLRLSDNLERYFTRMISLE